MHFIGLSVSQSEAKTWLSHKLGQTGQVASFTESQVTPVVQIARDEEGLEWWEKLPVEKQDRVPLPPPTPEDMENIHWQLVPELDEKSLQTLLKGNRRLPGGDCTCKACTVHTSKPLLQVLELLQTHKLSFICV